MAIRVAEFTSKDEYQSWLATYGSRIRIVDVSPTNRWPIARGFLGDAKTCIATFDELPPNPSEPQRPATQANGPTAPLRSDDDQE